MNPFVTPLYKTNLMYWEDLLAYYQILQASTNHTWNLQVTMNPVQGLERSATRLYRDCLRLVDHIASKSPKGQQLRMILRNEFKKNMGETDPEKIKVLKGNAVRGLSNYLVHESGSNDPRLKQRMDAVKTHALSDLKQREQREGHQR